MTERRPHWSDDLIETVSSSINRYVGAQELNPSLVHSAIAAVEDWVLSAPIFDLYLSRKHAPDRAAIQRVRELHYNCATHHPAGCCHQCGGTYPCLTIRALDGDSDA